ncbi:hypothetical protein G8J22_00566 [Lentilactobacillus hilgardii]|uniref:hypothetical protein n=1 Tax=Lentilactobacillus hilgardii TaxID=1588 RepID=UPI0002EA9455|nr:hypothetical protein [Lentilactobacillus hilgardii]MCT3395823.1 hypothetical protein [Lentilactobacillus hilgardii]QIR08632.1 hypothetical protein G8J22_00566 [Lentilactobacillus hilgardii]
MRKRHFFKILSWGLFPLLLALFSLSSLGYTVNADSSSIPAIYNGTDTYSKSHQSLTNDDGLALGARFNMDGTNSMYTGDKVSNSWYFPTAIFNLNAYKDNSDGTSNLTEQVQINNTTSSTKQINIQVILPKPIFGGSYTNHPIIQYAKAQATTPSSNSDGLTTTYYADNSTLTDTSSATDWANANNVIISGTLKAGSNYELTLPLKLTNASTVDAYNIGNAF